MADCWSMTGEQLWESVGREIMLSDIKNDKVMNLLFSTQKHLNIITCGRRKGRFIRTKNQNKGCILPVHYKNLAITYFFFYFTVRRKKRIEWLILFSVQIFGIFVLYPVQQPNWSHTILLQSSSQNDQGKGCGKIFQ